MTAELNRFVHGYPAYSFLSAGGVIVPAGNQVYNLPSGPGEILGFCILKYGGANADYSLLNVNITIDGVVIFNNNLFALFGMNAALTGHSMHSTNDVSTATIVSSSFRFRMAYEVSASITYTNNGAANITIAVGIHSRRGA